MATKGEKNNQDRSLLYIFAYVFEWLSGIIVYLIVGDKNPRLKKHAIQAILLGVMSIVIALIFGFLLIPIASSIINLIIWVYGIFAGVKAYYGVDVIIPKITPYAERHAGYQTGLKTKKKEETTKTNDTEAIKALKLRYAQGKITKKRYETLKKELES